MAAPDRGALAAQVGATRGCIAVRRQWAGGALPVGARWGGLHARLTCMGHLRGRGVGRRLDQWPTSVASVLWGGHAPAAQPTVGLDAAPLLR